MPSSELSPQNYYAAGRAADDDARIYRSGRDDGALVLRNVMEDQYNRPYTNPNIIDRQSQAPGRLDATEVPQSYRSSRSYTSDGSDSSISPSESVSNVSSRSSQCSTSCARRRRDDPQQLYDYVAVHLRYGENDGAVWHRETNSYVTVIRPRDGC
ncbi:hypothetical protein LTR56_019094 [Elasticomyces elasticus]|nr:hypothetical protein LTR56_019094 [Elasticomyces elasticus]KAK3635495.1 hypothetical protein LTR22_019175 [Elasticomyces elasticus]KAK4911594.1 hypothetical protein LTR49_019844 [Elasticomyces elasticus]KAK5765619.1 hypothetical protein LTS12_004123 [Elasticomyces elasticus]